MTTAIKLKKSSVGGKVPLPEDIEYGELALNYADGKLFYKNSTNDIRSFLDSTQTINLVDSAYVNARLDTSLFLDSADAIQLIDSAYVNARLDASLFLDSTDAINLIDSAYVNARLDASLFLDSADAIQLIDSAYVNARLDRSLFINSAEAVDIIDSAYVNARLDRSLFINSAEAIDLIDSAYVQSRYPEAATKTGIETLTNKTLTTPAINTSFTLDSNVFYGQTYGVSINVDSDLGDSTQTAYLFGTKGSADSSVIIGLGRNGQFYNFMGTAGTLLKNRVVIGSQFGNTDFEIRNNLGVSPADLDGGTLLFRVDSNGNASIPSPTQSLNKTTGALVVTGGIATQNNIYANEIYSSTILSGATITGKYLGFDSDFASKTTSNLTEGSNKYYTKVRFDSDFGAKSTTGLAEGTNLYYTTARADSDAKRSVSATSVSGFGSISYDNTTGVISYVGPSTTDVRQSVSAGTGVNYDSTTGIFSLPQAVGPTDSVQFSGISVSNNVVIDGNLFVFGTQTITSTASLSVSTPFIRVADSNTNDVVDIGFIGQYSLDSGVTPRFTGLIRDATNSEYYLFNNLVQNALNDSNPPVTININGTGYQPAILNVGTLKGKYGGFDSDARAFGRNFLVKTSNYTAVSGDKILANTGGGSFDITLPASPIIGDNVTLYDINNWETNNLNVLRNGSTIEGYDSDFVLDIGQIKVEFIYGNSTWQLFASVGPEGPAGPPGPAGAQGESASTALIAGLAIALS